MIITYEKSFLKDIKKLDNQNIAKKLKDILINFENSDNFQGFQNIKKLKNFDIYYRIKIGDYRLGFKYENNQISIIRFLHRKNIYKLFP